MIHYIAPIRGAVGGRKRGRDVPLGHAAAAYRYYGEWEAELLCNQLVVFREDVQGPEADVSETDDAYVYGFHDGLKLYDRAQCAITSRLV
jgi:hypothetical protein